MILTIDIGNTTVSLSGVVRDPHQGYAVCFCGKVDTVPSWGTTDYLQAIRGLLKKLGAAPEDFEGAVLSSVVPCLIPPLSSCVRILTGKEPVLITKDSRTGLTMQVPEPEGVGLDRLVDAAWTAETFPLPAVTVDMGTATTFNVLDEDRRFLGGVIAPGLHTGLSALSHRAAQLPNVALDTPDYVIGRNTEECMLSGAVVGAAAMVDGMVSRIEGELGQPVTLVITGGLARYAESLCTHPHIYDPHLLTKGLALLYDKNCDAAAV